MSEENNENSAPQRDQATQDWITGVKERKELQDKLAEKERENNILKGKIHEMTKKLEDLEKQVRLYCYASIYTLVVEFIYSCWNKILEALLNLTKPLTSNLS